MLAAGSFAHPLLLELVVPSLGGSLALWGQSYRRRSPLAASAMDTGLRLGSRPHGRRCDEGYDRDH
jgi:hypothetical protein